MTLVNELSVFQKTYEFYRSLHLLVKKFPKSDQYTLGEQSKNTTIAMLEAITVAGEARKQFKIPPLDQALLKLELLKIFVRLAYETRCLSEQQYLDLQTKLQEIGRELGAWRKSI